MIPPDFVSFTVHTCWLTSLMCPLYLCGAAIHKTPSSMFNMKSW